MLKKTVFNNSFLARNKSIEKSIISELKKFIFQQKSKTIYSLDKNF